jgi:predicted enzyme related to lactoylglutathione lyase
MTQRPSVHLSIDVPDLEKGLSYYGSVFGFIETARPFPSMAILDGGNLMICMHQRPAGTESSPGSGATRHYHRHWTPVHMDMHVDDFDCCLASVVDCGGAVEIVHRDTGPRPVAFCADPFGHGFCVLGPPPQNDASATNGR